jgi:hypothetical protein
MSAILSADAAAHIDFRVEYSPLLLLLLRRCAPQHDITIEKTLIVSPILLCHTACVVSA